MRDYQKGKFKLGDLVKLKESEFSELILHGIIKKESDGIIGTFKITNIDDSSIKYDKINIFDILKNKPIEPWIYSYEAVILKSQDWDS